jgi:hypothetical protein
MIAQTTFGPFGARGEVESAESAAMETAAGNETGRAIMKSAQIAQRENQPIPALSSCKGERFISAQEAFRPVTENFDLASCVLSASPTDRCYRAPFTGRYQK